MMDAIEKSLLEQVSGLHDIPAGAYSLRINGALDSKASSAHITIEKKTDLPGINIIIAPGTRKMPTLYAYRKQRQRRWGKNA